MRSEYVLRICRKVYLVLKSDSSFVCPDPLAWQGQGTGLFLSAQALYPTDTQLAVEPGGTSSSEAIR